MDCLALQYIPHISALWPVWLYSIFYISEDCGLPCSISYSTFSHNPHDLLKNWST